MADKTGKVQFSVGEKVLCYEPDTRKAKVLYDSKVLNVLVNKDSKGKNSVDYLIHFQGWSASWDRYVHEEFVLKDNPENRQLQKDLAEQSHLHFGVYLYRERKKPTRKVPVREKRNTTKKTKVSQACTPVAAIINAIVQEEPVLLPSTPEEDVIVEEDLISLELNEYFASVLLNDYHLINNKNKLLALPATPTISSILDAYWQFYSVTLCCNKNESSSRKSSYTPNQKAEEVQRNLILCKQMLDGLRIYFDFTIDSLLLYQREKNQVHIKMATVLPPADYLFKNDLDIVYSLENIKRARLTGIPPNETLRAIHNAGQNNHSPRKKNLRSNAATDTPDIKKEILKFESASAYVKEALVNLGITNTELLNKVVAKHLLPNYVYYQYMPPPTLIYGATHLLRLFVKLPELLNTSWIPEAKLKVLVKHLEGFLVYLDDHKEWFGDSHYE